MRMAVRVEGELNETALQRSRVRLVESHERLRTRFGSESGEAVQWVGSASDFALEREDYSEHADREDRLRARLVQESEHRFDLGRGGLFRVVLVKLGAQEHAL